jgi:hypothetical protein
MLYAHAMRVPDGTPCMLVTSAPVRSVDPVPPREDAAFATAFDRKTDERLDDDDFVREYA